MIRVRRHERQLASGKVTTVRQHERNADVTAGQGGLRPRDEDEWWDRPDMAEMQRDEDPEGTWYFREGSGELMAVHPDGTAHPVPEEEETVDEAAYRHDNEMFGPEDADPEWATEPDWDDAETEDPEVENETSDLGGSDVAAGRGAVRTPGHTEQDMRQSMREWRARDVPLLPREPMTPQMQALLGCETAEGREKFERLRAYREAGYDGPLGPDNQIPDPDDPSNDESISALAYMRWQEETR